MDIVTIETPSLGDRSYVVLHDDVAVVIDPQRDIDRVLDLVRDRGATVSHVLETHIHNDYVTGGYALAELLDATYVLNDDDDVAFARHGVRDGDELTAGQMTVRVIATPGHTFNHLAYAISVPGEPPALFSGGSLLYGSTGRPDLLGDEHTDELVKAQYDSAHRLTRELPGQTQLLPTHGFGSFCAATQSEGDSGTLDDERAINPVLTEDRDTFVADIVANLDAYPAYYVHMAPANSAGPDQPDLSLPEPAEADELLRRIDAGEWVVDLRNRTAFAPGHVPGTVNIGQDDSFVTYLGWLMPWQAPVTLLGSIEQVTTAQRDLVRIGINGPAAVGIGEPRDWAGGRSLAQYDLVTYKDLVAAREQDQPPYLLDVRRDGERAESHIPDTQHIPIHELPQRLDEVSGEGPVWVHCVSGYRASIAVSLLARAGHDVTLVDDDYERARDLGLVVDHA